MIRRRNLLKAAFALSVLPAAARSAEADDGATPKAAGARDTVPITTRRIPSSGETVPVIGLGTSRTFDVGKDEARRAALLPVLESFFAGGGRLIDSSPMYGSAEEVTGDLLRRLGRPTAFVATKVWADGADAGRAQMQDSARKLATERLDLIQVHNLRDWRTHLRTLRTWKEEGRVRYIGITTSRREQYPEFEQVMRAEALDFVQLNYSAGEREAEQTLLPLAAERQMAVLVNRPFMRSELFERVRGRTMPDWAADWGCSTWGQLFLKFAWSHPAVTCVIPATAKLSHMQDNLAAGRGREPDEDFRQRLLRELG